jgi:putative IMPACT (imprinted ancient) family translation regulator
VISRCEPRSRSTFALSHLFVTLAAPAEAQIREKVSVFLARAAPVETEAEARAVLAEREKAMWDATHHCSAWSLRSCIRRGNDAGKPSGSAGAPILAAIEGGAHRLRRRGDALVRGTKLGVGGLMRAYGEAVARAAGARRTGVEAARLRGRRDRAG